MRWGAKKRGGKGSKRGRGRSRELVRGARASERREQASKGREGCGWECGAQKEGWIQFPHF